MAYNPQSSSTPLLGQLDGQISADDESAAEQGRSRAYDPSNSQSAGVSGSVQPPAARGSVNVNGAGSADANASIWQQSAHPVALFCLFFFRSAAIATYLLCGFFVSSYVFSVRARSSERSLDIHRSMLTELSCADGPRGRPPCTRLLDGP